MRAYLFICAVLFSGFVFGQQETFISGQEKDIDSLKINNIENLVDSIQFDQTLQKTSIDSISLAGKFAEKQEFYEAEIYYKGNEIIRINLSQSGVNFASQYSVGGSIVDYFLENNKLIFANEKYTDNGRTGSCGAMEMQNKLYYSEGELIHTRTNGLCYEPRINLNGWTVFLKKFIRFQSTKLTKDTTHSNANKI